MPKRIATWARHWPSVAGRARRSPSVRKRCGSARGTRRRLDGWQRAGDERMWKLIVSPEFGEQIDLKRLTRELMGRIERELGGASLEWVAVTDRKSTRLNSSHLGISYAV